MYRDFNFNKNNKEIYIFVKYLKNNRIKPAVNKNFKIL